MGAYSTMDISRERAIEHIEKALENVENMTDEELSEIMFVLYGDKWGANFRIIEGESDECWG